MNWFRDYVWSQDRSEGSVESWRMGNTKCRALINSSNRIISKMDCWELPRDHPLIGALEERIMIRCNDGSYLLNGREHLKRYEVNI